MKRMHRNRKDVANGCCKLGYPKGYYAIGDNDDKEMMVRIERKSKCTYKDGRGMKDRMHGGPAGYWGI